jgi:hypothetical protein
MYLAGGHKKDIAAFEDDFLVASEKSPGAADDNVNFVACMRLLRVGAMGRVKLYAEGTVLEQFGEALALGSREAGKAIFYSKVSVHDSIDLIRRLRSRLSASRLPQ